MDALYISTFDRSIRPCPHHPQELVPSMSRALATYCMEALVRTLIDGRPSRLLMGVLRRGR